MYMYEQYVSALYTCTRIYIVLYYYYYNYCKTKNNIEITEIIQVDCKSITYVTVAILYRKIL